MPKFVYVEMACKLNQKYYREKISIDGIVVASIETINSDVLFDCYIQTFDKGDAKFFKLQDEEEKKRYFNEELGFPIVLENPASFAYLFDDNVVGFALVMPYLEKNFHICCMCIKPEYQNRGLGKTMLNRIKNIALENDCKSLTLGTEPEMKAYHLYKNNGFRVTEEHIVEM